jgi:adenylate kinase family enzyme
MRILLLGEQGSGKGTLGRDLKKALGGEFLSAGDLLRAEARRDTPRGRQVAERLAAFEGASVEDAYAVLDEALQQIDPSRPLVLDGYPRMVDQIPRLHRVLGGEPDCALLLQVPTVVTVGRILNRLTCEACGRTYGPWIPARRADQCDRCSGRLSHREDDGMEGLQARQRFWRHHGPAIVQIYRAAGIVQEVDASPLPDIVLDQAVRRLPTGKPQTPGD